MADDFNSEVTQLEKYNVATVWRGHTVLGTRCSWTDSSTHCWPDDHQHDQWMHRSSQRTGWMADYSHIHATQHTNWYQYTPINIQYWLSKCQIHNLETNALVFCSSELDDFSSLCDTTDTRLFTGILHNTSHILQPLLTPPTDHNYDLRDRLHNISSFLYTILFYVSCVCYVLVYYSQTLQWLYLLCYYFVLVALFVVYICTWTFSHFMLGLTFLRFM